MTDLGYAEDWRAEPHPPDPDMIRETIRHACGHDADYETPIGLVGAPVDASQSCWRCRASRCPDPFSDDSRIAAAGDQGLSADDVDEIEAQWMADFYGWPRNLNGVHHAAWDAHLGIERMPAPPVDEERQEFKEARGAAMFVGWLGGEDETP